MEATPVDLKLRLDISNTEGSLSVRLYGLDEEGHVIDIHEQGLIPEPGEVEEWNRLIYVPQLVGYLAKQMLIGRHLLTPKEVDDSMHIRLVETQPPPPVF